MACCDLFLYGSNERVGNLVLTVESYKQRTRRRRIQKDRLFAKESFTTVAAAAEFIRPIRYTVPSPPRSGLEVPKLGQGQRSLLK